DIFERHRDLAILTRAHSAVSARNVQADLAGTGIERIEPFDLDDPCDVALVELLAMVADHVDATRHSADEKAIVMVDARKATPEWLADHPPGPLPPGQEIPRWSPSFSVEYPGLAAYFHRGLVLTSDSEQNCLLQLADFAATALTAMQRARYEGKRPV